MIEEPNLFREIRSVAWFVTKLLLVVAMVIGLFSLVFVHHPVVGMWVFYALVFISQIVFYGWQNYKWKRSNWKWQQEQERDRQLREAEDRLRDRGPRKG